MNGKFLKSFEDLSFKLLYATLLTVSIWDVVKKYGQEVHAKQIIDDNTKVVRVYYW